MASPRSERTPDQLELGVVLAALADDHRRRVIRELALDPSNTDRTCTSFELPVSKSTNTHHFRVLESAGLIANVDYGNRKGVTLRRAAIDEAFPGLLTLLTQPA